MHVLVRIRGRASVSFTVHQSGPGGQTDLRNFRGMRQGMVEKLVETMTV